MSLPELSGITSHLGRGDISSWSRHPGSGEILPQQELQGGEAGPRREDQSLGPFPREGTWGRTGACLPSSVWPLGCGSALWRRIGCLPSLTAPQGSLQHPVDPSPASLCPGNLVICLPLVPQEGMGLGRTQGSGPGFPPWGPAVTPGGASQVEL